MILYSTVVLQYCTVIMITYITVQYSTVYIIQYTIYRDNYLRHGPRAQAEYHHGFEHCI